MQHGDSPNAPRRGGPTYWRFIALVLLAPICLQVLAATPNWPRSWYGTSPPASLPFQPHPVAQQQGESAQPVTPPQGDFSYRPLQQRPGLPPNSSGTPGTYSYSYSSSGPGNYSYSYRIQRRGGYPYQQQVPQTARPSQPPTVETVLSERRALVQQNLIYRLRIHSSGNLKEAAPVLPQLESVIFRQLGSPQSYASGSGSQGTGLTTEYTYLLIPLQAGTIHLPPPTVTGKYLDNTPYSVTAEHANTLYVQPPPDGISPWLPLYDLQLEAHLSDQTRASAGEPMTLEIVTTAIGAVGSQLPSVEEQLQSEHFYIYPGEVTEEGRVSSDGLDLLGSRVERFTLVPRYGGRLTLPAMSITWWNLRTGKPDTATLPMRQFQVAGPVGDSPQVTESGLGLGGGKHLFFWLPLLIVAVILVLGWLRVIFGSGYSEFGRRLGLGAQNLLGSIYLPLMAFAQRLSPRRHFHRLRTWIGRRLPVSWKLWYCLRAVDREEDPYSWEQALQILAAKHLGARPHASLKELAPLISNCHPAANAEEIRQLFSQLDQAIYGGRPIASFDKWKEDFKRQIKPRLFPIRLRQCSAGKRENGLPSLNPTI